MFINLHNLLQSIVIKFNYIYSYLKALSYIVHTLKYIYTRIIYEVYFCNIQCVYKFIKWHSETFSARPSFPALSDI